MPTRTSADIELAVLQGIRDGLTSSAVASKFGLSTYTVRDIKRRCGAPGKIGRPSLSKPLTEYQQVLVLEHMHLAERIAVRLCREKSKAMDLEKPDYIGVALLALVAAASRWQQQGSFKAYFRKNIEWAIRDYRRSDMLANGWSRQSSRDSKMEQVAHRVGDKLLARVAA